MNKRNFIIIILSLALTTSCGKPNVLTEYSTTDSDQAFYLDAKNLIDDSSWDAAITILTTKLSASYRARTDVKTTLMYAYGGKCGISFLNLINNLKTAQSTEMFKIALGLFTNTNVNVAACDLAIDTLHSIGATAADRQSEHNLFAAILGITRMGTTLHSKFDKESGGLGDGTVDVGWNSCVVSNAALRLSDDDMNRIVSGVGLIFENLAALGDQLTSGSAGSSFDAAKTLCEATIPMPTIGIPYDWDNNIANTVKWSDLPLTPRLPDPPTWVNLGLPSDFSDPINCLNTHADQVPDKMRRIFRRMIASSSMGFGTCNLSSVNVQINPNANPLAAITMGCCPTEIPAP